MHAPAGPGSRWARLALDVPGEFKVVMRLSIASESLGLGEGVGGHFIEDLEVADLDFHEFLAIAFG
jgi:hypothetical protein